jgi:hypothetical protein
LRLNPPYIAGPGQFWILGITAISYILFFGYISLRMGKAIHSETDGCLLCIINVVLVVIGGMAGLLVFRFPYNLMSSMFFALLLPGSLTLMWVKRTLPPRRP